MSLKQRILKYIALKIGPYLHIHASEISANALPAFPNQPRNLRIALPYSLGHPDRITLGDDVTLGPGCRLIPIIEYPGERMRRPNTEGPTQRFDPRITIGNRVSATADLQIFSQQRVSIEDDVMFAANVFINDGSHGYKDGETPYKYQPMEKIAPIIIKRGSWIGQNVVVLAGVTIGEYCIVGANSVVTRSIPPNSIAVGSPARVVKRWDANQKTWAAARNSEL